MIEQENRKRKMLPYDLDDEKKEAWRRDRNLEMC